MIRHYVSCILMLGTLLSAPFMHAQKTTSKGEIIEKLRTIIQSTANIHPQVKLDLDSFMSHDLENSQEDAFLKLIEDVIKFAAHQLAPEHLTYLKKTKKGLELSAKSYKASGSTVSINSNGAFFINTFKPQFTMTFKNKHGAQRRRTYQAHLDLIGLNIELTFRLSWFFFLGNVNFFDTNKTIELGPGIEIEPVHFLMPIIPYCAYGDIRFPDGGFMTVPTIEAVILHVMCFYLVNPIITYCPFKNIPDGGLLIISRPLLGIDLGSLSLVRGGTLTPL